MDYTEFGFIRRHSLKKTQKQTAELLGVSLRAVQSFEQGWRKIPTHIERQILFLLAMQNLNKQPSKPCWELLNCDSERKVKCPAWEFHCGHWCWFINGTICQGKAHPDWKEKMDLCRKCKVFQSLFPGREHS